MHDFDAYAIQLISNASANAPILLIFITPLLSFDLLAVYQFSFCKGNNSLMNGFLARSS